MVGRRHQADITLRLRTNPIAGNPYSDSETARIQHNATFTRWRPWIPSSAKVKQKLTAVNHDLNIAFSDTIQSGGEAAIGPMYWTPVPETEFLSALDTIRPLSLSNS